jgi:RNA polymerase sigma factor (sigma-70 family)
VTRRLAAAPQPAYENKKLSWSDEKLVVACVKGDEQAWEAVIDRYKNLIFSIPIKYGLTREDAADVFQAVCVEFLRELPRVRDVKALPKWLIQVSAHKCAQHRHKEARFIGADAEQIESLRGPENAVSEQLLQDAEREQSLRTAVASLPERCRELVRLLFYEQPPRPYAEIAAQLHLAVGSIGFIRGRCLAKLRRALVEAGFE